MKERKTNLNFNKYLILLFYDRSQSSSCVSIATPLLIQCAYVLLEGNFIFITKFVECPVVDNTPLLSEVLYTGQS